MRPLFKSETRMISNLMFERLNVSTADFGVVHSEMIIEPKDKSITPRFNNDFVLEFAARPFPECETATIVAPILPNSIAGTANLLLDKTGPRPLLFEVMFGESLGIKHYRRYIRAVETWIDSILKDSGIAAGTNNLRQEHITRIEKTAYCRIMVIGVDICFLVFPRLLAPAMEGIRKELVDSSDGQVDCYRDGAEIVCFDGWLRTEVRQTERRLVAVSDCDE